MPIPVRATFPTDRSDLSVLVTDDGSLTLVKTGSEDTFHSGCGAASETRHVYLQNSGVVDRIADQRPTRVLEVGLGTSMGMLMTVEWARRHDTKLHYLAIETDWITADTLDFLNPRAWCGDESLVDAYQSFRRTLPASVLPGVYCWQVDAQRVVEFSITDVRQWNIGSGHRFDAIYYDPFCPDSAPELWTARCLRSMRDAIDDHGRLTTYSCSRAVRDALSAARWDVQRVPGPVGGKREVIIAVPAVH